MTSTASLGKELLRAVARSKEAADPDPTVLVGYVQAGYLSPESLAPRGLYGGNDSSSTGPPCAESLTNSFTKN